MSKVLISVLGSDQPGIIAIVSNVINKRNGNIENLSQTLLNDVFGALLQAELAEGDSAEALQQAIEAACEDMALFIRVHSWSETTSDWHQHKPEVQPYIVTAIGPDSQGLVAEIAGKLFTHGANITNIQAIFKGGDNPMNNLMVFEVDVPRATEMNDLRDALDDIAKRLALEVNVQHRKIFDSVSNILN
ncbi:glycine cleavage system protein R [Methylophaga thiooxydans]|uniref:glycine cleavage system protein R n=1 Tax=Methylophaga thiooxydans TaxID=392484 RepID=UPI0023560520|nr:ACT domain-containing protein [Methylophaga thiooxydans]